MGQLATDWAQIKQALRQKDDAIDKQAALIAALQKPVAPQLDADDIKAVADIRSTASATAPATPASASAATATVRAAAAVHPAPAASATPAVAKTVAPAAAPAVAQTVAHPAVTPFTK